jgi:hypothetical protein
MKVAQELRTGLLHGFTANGAEDLSYCGPCHGSCTVYLDPPNILPLAVSAAVIEVHFISNGKEGGISY